MEEGCPEFVVACGDIETTADWFADAAGFRMIMLRPADEPTIAVLEGHGVRIRLDRNATGGAGGLRIPVAEQPERSSLVGPNGTTVEFVPSEQPDDLPENKPVFTINRAADADFGPGRAGMLYRDLIPERQGGRYIASHITIPIGGPVPDYVHHHHIRFQMIFCNTGWADLVYEDQGPPFRFEAGDCVLQPPHIRHRVLETSDAFEVVEISSPAVHDTLRDHDLILPTDAIRPDRDFGGQRFVHHRSTGADWGPWRMPGFRSSDFGIGHATNGLAWVATVRAEPGATIAASRPTEEFTIWFLRSGRASLTRNGDAHQLEENDSVVLVAGEMYGLDDASDDLEFLEVRVP